MKIGEYITVDSLKQDNFTILHPDSTLVVQVKTARAAIVVEDEEDEEGLEGEETTAEGEETAEAAAGEAAAEGKE